MSRDSINLTTFAGSVADRLAGAMFYTSAVLSLAQCWRLSYLWENISQYWSAIERSLNIKHVPIDTKISRRIYHVLIIVSTIFISMYFSVVLDVTNSHLLLYFLYRILQDRKHADNSLDRKRLSNAYRHQILQFAISLIKILNYITTL